MTDAEFAELNGMAMAAYTLHFQIIIYIQTMIFAAERHDYENVQRVGLLLSAAGRDYAGWLGTFNVSLLGWVRQGGMNDVAIMEAWLRQATGRPQPEL